MNLDLPAGHYHLPDFGCPIRIHAGSTHHDCRLDISYDDSTATADPPEGTEARLHCQDHNVTEHLVLTLQWVQRPAPTATAGKLLAFARSTR